MQYIDPLKGTITPYPDHNIDPRKKGLDWCVAYAKAAWADFSYGIPKGIFSNNQGDYQKFRLYAMGKQPISQYQTLLGIDEQNKNTWLSIDWSVRPIISGYRDMAISRLMKNDYQIVATPVDSLAKSELQTTLAEFKTKIMIRQLAMQEGNEELANHPLIAPQRGEPMDIEELEMRLTMGEQFNRSKDAEMAVELGFFENKYNFWRKEIYEDLFDYGVAGYREWLGTDNKPHFYRVNPEDVIISYSRKADFSDIVHAGAAIDVSLVDLATFTDKDGNLIFTDEEMQTFAGSIAGKWGNPLEYRGYTGFRGYDKFKCKVLDLEFYSYDRYSYKDTTDENGNIDFGSADYNRGKESEKYKRKKFKCVYKVKWIVGTDKAYDFGLAYDQKRSNLPQKKWDTELSFKFIAMNLYEMKAQGMMERVIPNIDEYQLTRYKLQNFKNRLVPSGWWIDLDAMESVALSKGGASMSPKELLTMFFETGVLVGRSVNEDGTPKGNNWKPVIPIENSVANELAMLVQDLQFSLSEIERMTGYNQITAGNPNPKTLVPGYEMANESTNDALYPLAAAETNLTERLAYDVLRRTQQALKKGAVEGYALAININALTIMSISPDISLREYGIMLQKKTTEPEKMMLLQAMQEDIRAGFLDSSDSVTLINTHNVKQAEMIWSYKVKRNKEMMQQQEMQKIELNNQGAKEAAMIAQQAASEQQQMKMQFDMAMKQMELQAEIEKERLKLDYQYRMNTESNMTKLQISDQDNEGRVGSAAIQGEAKQISQQIAAQATIEAARMKKETGGNEKK
jgi:hypothetical protein